MPETKTEEKKERKDVYRDVYEELRGLFKKERMLTYQAKERIALLLSRVGFLADPNDIIAVVNDAIKVSIVMREITIHIGVGWRRISAWYEYNYPVPPSPE